MTLAFLALLGAPYIYDISSLRVKIILGQVTDMVFETFVYTPFNHLKASSPRKFYWIQTL